MHASSISQQKADLNHRRTDRLKKKLCTLKLHCLHLQYCIENKIVQRIKMIATEVCVCGERWVHMLYVLVGMEAKGQF